MQRGNGFQWNEEEARKAVGEFFGLLGDLESEYPQCVGRLRAGWKRSYIRCGHKRLGRLVLGYSPEDACAKRQTRGGGE